MLDLITRVYERRPQHYLRFCIAVGFAAFTLLAFPAGAYVAARFEGLSMRQYLTALLALEVAIALAGAAIAFSVRQQIRAIDRWLRGDTTPEATEAARAAVPDAADKVALRIWASTLAAAVPFLVVAFLAPVDRVTFTDVVVLLGGTVITVLYGTLLVWFWADLCIRPINVELAALGAEPVKPRLVRLGLMGRLMIGVFTATSVAGIVVGTTYSDHGAGAGALAAVWAVSVGVGLLSALLLVLLLNAVVIVPIRDLTAAARSVGAGELDTRVIVNSEDDIGTLGQTFNEMVAGLQERDALKLDNVALSSSLQDSRARLVAASDAERRRMERDLHDGAQQHLVMLRLKLGMLLKTVAGQPDACAIAEEATEDLNHALAELRDLAHGMYPTVLESDGLASALSEAARRTALPVTVTSDGAGRYGRELEAAVYFCCLEALQNAAKHAGDGAHVVVALAERGGLLHVEITDDGAGFSSETRAASSGLQNMADRIGALHGELRIQSAPGEGTRVVATVPLRADAGR